MQENSEKEEDDEEILTVKTKSKQVIVIQK